MKSDGVLLCTIDLALIFCFLFSFWKNQKWLALFIIYNSWNYMELHIYFFRIWGLCILIAISLNPGCHKSIWKIISSKDQRRVLLREHQGRRMLTYPRHFLFFSEGWNIRAQICQETHFAPLTFKQFLWEPIIMKSRFLRSNIRQNPSLNPGMFFQPALLTLQLFDHKVYPEGLGIVMEKKLLNNSS